MTISRATNSPARFRLHKDIFIIKILPYFIGIALERQSVRSIAVVGSPHVFIQY